MPFYQFKCTSEKCDFDKDQLVKMGTEEIECPICKSVAKKQLSFRFAAHGLPNGHNAVRTKK